MKQRIKSLLGPNGVRFCLRLVDRIRLSWLRMAYRSAFLCRLHYLLFSSSFTREAQGVIAGHIRFEENKKNGESINYFLRRCIHRLEKGLIMRPRRDVFAADYIEEAVASYVAGRENLNPDEALWANDVLTEYFSVTGRNPAVDNARSRFEQFLQDDQAPGRTGTGQNKPYVRPLEDPPPVDHAAFRALSVRRRSVRWFRQEPVPRQLVDQAIETASLAPSACNRQPFEYRLFDDPALIRPLLELPMGITGYEDNVPAVAVLVGKLRAYPHPRDRHVIYIDASLSAMSFMYALETLGLSSCPINWPDVPDRERRMKELLGLALDERPVMLIAFGYPDPDGMVPKSTKIPLPDIRSYNRLSSA